MKLKVRNHNGVNADTIQDFIDGGQGNDFAKRVLPDLLRQYLRYGGLTEKQWDFAKSLMAPPAPPLTMDLGDVTALVSLLNKADHPKRRRRPSIVIMSDRQPDVVVEFKLAGPKSKYCGSVNVTDGGPFGNNKWYGRLDPGGTWTQGRRQLPEMGEVMRIMQAMARDPAGTAKAHGDRHGSCCFCTKRLDTDTSKALGYGPTCAKTYGLPHNVKAAASIAA